MLHRLQAGDVAAAIAELDRSWRLRANEIQDWLSETSPSDGA